MKKINLISLAVVLITGLVLLNSAYAQTLVVSRDPKPGQYASIPEAIAAAEEGDTILVLSVDYNSMEEIVLDKDVSILFEEGAENTTLPVTGVVDPDGRVFFIHSDIKENSNAE